MIKTFDVGDKVEFKFTGTICNIELGDEDDDCAIQIKVDPFIPDYASIVFQNAKKVEEIAHDN